MRKRVHRALTDSVPAPDLQLDRCPAMALRGRAASARPSLCSWKRQGRDRCSNDSECRSPSDRSGSRAARNDLAGNRLSPGMSCSRQSGSPLVRQGATGLLMRAPLLGLTGGQPGPGAQSPMSPEVPWTPTFLGPKTVAARRWPDQHGYSSPPNSLPEIGRVQPDTVVLHPGPAPRDTGPPARGVRGLSAAQDRRSGGGPGRRSYPSHPPPVETLLFGASPPPSSNRVRLASTPSSISMREHPASSCSGGAPTDLFGQDVGKGHSGSLRSFPACCTAVGLEQVCLTRQSKTSRTGWRAPCKRR